MVVLETPDQEGLHVEVNLYDNWTDEHLLGDPVRNEVWEEAKAKRFVDANGNLAGSRKRKATPPPDRTAKRASQKGPVMLEDLLAAAMEEESQSAGSSWEAGQKLAVRDVYSES